MYALIAHEHVLERPVLCLRIYTVVSNSLLPLATQQRKNAAIFSLVWKILPATSAARISARYAEEAVAASAPAVRFVGALTFSSLVLWCHAPLVNHAVLVVRDLGNGGNVADTEAATKHLATVSQENVHYSPPPPHRQV